MSKPRGVERRSAEGARDVTSKGRSAVNTNTFAPLGGYGEASLDEIRLLTLSDALSGRRGFLVRLLMKLFVA
jgi:hypothetical protein